MNAPLHFNAFVPWSIGRSAGNAQQQRIMRNSCEPHEHARRLGREQRELAVLHRIRGARCGFVELFVDHRARGFAVEIKDPTTIGVAADPHQVVTDLGDANRSAISTGEKDVGFALIEVFAALVVIAKLE